MTILKLCLQAPLGGNATAAGCAGPRHYLEQNYSFFQCHTGTVLLQCLTPLSQTRQVLCSAVRANSMIDRGTVF